MCMRARIRSPRRAARGLVALCAVSVSMIAMSVTARAAGSVRVTEAPSSAGSSTAISTSQFVNQFDTEPYVGNGYFSQRIPAAGMGLLTGLGTIGWPLGTPRFTEALAAGLYAKTNASLTYYPDETKQVIALIPMWSTLTFATASGDTYSPATVALSQISNYLQTEDLQTGTVTTSGTWTSAHGEQANFKYQVFTDLARNHVGVVSLPLTPQWTGRTTVTGLRDGAGASRLQAAGAGGRSPLAHQLRQLHGDRDGLSGIRVVDYAVLVQPPQRTPRWG